MAAVLENLVDVEVLRLGEPVTDPVQEFLYRVVAFGVVPLFDEFVDPIGVNDNRGGLRKSVGDVGKLADGNLPVEDKSGDACKRAEQDFGRDDDDDDLAEQGVLEEFVLVVDVGLKEERLRKETLEVLVDEPVADDGRRDDDGLVENVDDDVCRELREELGKTEGAVDGVCERCRDALAEVVAIEEVGEDRTEPAADKRENEDACDDFRDMEEKFPLLEKGRRDADQDADDAVVEGRDVGDAVEGVGEKADDDGGKRAAQHGDKDCADRIKEYGKLEVEREFGGDDIEQ